MDGVLKKALGVYTLYMSRNANCGTIFGGDLASTRVTKPEVHAEEQITS